MWSTARRPPGSSERMPSVGNPATKRRKSQARSRVPQLQCFRPARHPAADLSEIRGAIRLGHGGKRDEDTSVGAGHCCCRCGLGRSPLAAAVGPVHRPRVEPRWAFPVQAGTLPPESPEPKSVEGSTKKYTPKEIDDLMNPPDWFPEAHKPAPSIVQKGHGAALACGSCHLMSGLGHPESGDLTGFTADYIVQQMIDFKAGTRKDYARMNGIAKEVSDEEAR